MKIVQKGWRSIIIAAISIVCLEVFAQNTANNLKEFSIGRDFSRTDPITMFSQGYSFRLTDISPDSKNGELINTIEKMNGSTAGLTIGIAGDQNGLYAVSLNAGIWKTQIGEGNVFEKWTQLQNSPRYSSSVAVDPQFPGHIVAGEKEGDKINISDNHCGLWESFDGGKTFTEAYFFNSFENFCPNEFRSHVVNQVIITEKSTALFASPCGIGRREYLAKGYTKVIEDHIRGIACYRNYVVARSANMIHFSTDDGKTWTSKQILYDNNKSNPLQSGEPGINGNERDGLYSVAIVEVQFREKSKTFVYLPATRIINTPNKCSILIYDIDFDKWTTQIINSGLGTGLGGTAFIKSFYIDLTNLKNEIGGKSQLIYCGGQDLFRANKINNDGWVDWKPIVGTTASSLSPKRLHPDIWNFYIDPLGLNCFAVHDGGISYQRLNENDIQRLKNLNPESYWRNLNQGLHTHHIHSVVAGCFIPSSIGAVQLKPALTDRISYSTADNQAWKNHAISESPNSIKDWQAIYGMGDVSFSYLDGQNSNFTLNFRDLYNTPTNPISHIGVFGSFVPPGSKLGLVNISQNISGVSGTSNSYGHQHFQIIQTLKGENVPEHLDALALVRLPLTYGSPRKNVNGPLGLSSWNGQVAIIRNKAFAKNPNTDNPNPSGWGILFSDLPANTLGFWVSGGHADPTIFVLDGSGIRKRKKTDLSWDLLPNTPSPLISLGNYGPLFVNPYDPSVVYVVCENGVYTYDVITRNYILDSKLTELITEKGSYPIINYFGGGTGDAGSYSLKVSQAGNLGMCTLSAMAFNPNHPTEIICGSPYTGIFYKDGNSEWQDLSYLLPKPFTPVSSVAFTIHGMYIATEGRGVFLIKK